MPSSVPRSAAVAVAAVFSLLQLVTLVAGQGSETVSLSMPPEATQDFDIAQVPEAQRFQWCLSQQNNCRAICEDSADVNECEQTDLSWECVCADGNAPDVSAYKETIPYFICEKAFELCMEENAGDAQGESECQDNRQCGERDAPESDRDDDQEDEDEDEDEDEEDDDDQDSGSEDAESSSESQNDEADSAAQVLSPSLITSTAATVLALAAIVWL